MSFDVRELRQVLMDDLFRYAGRSDFPSLLKFYFASPGFNFTCWLRVCGYLSAKRGMWRCVYQLCRIIHFRKSINYGISISPLTSIGRGLYIGHFGGIVVNERAVIGENCNLSQGVTIGKSNRGSRAGYPTIEDKVYLAPGCVVVGGIRIGDGAAVGANAVVIYDVEAGSVVAGSPARKVSDSGSSGYVKNCVSRGCDNGGQA